MEKEFRINEPCHIGRENMQDIPGGSFCDFCSKKVHDLTQKTDEESKKKNNIRSYFLTEAYAKELFEEYDVENGVIVSYRQ
ncbi:hypothetical protein BOQ62_04840 [Chryseobacterium sp. CH21]|uniref:hypothetical protein n=1 Tax=Chryseobacterium sp. CH21 TaxID=713556 RepID=UPI00100B3FD5|nr:hypothetical protein [Chryseobacterium sp. CH21]RXM40648.1 hypothetical protein BOQ62_04840 [Chryseobacterium sp. CH21]